MLNYRAVPGGQFDPECTHVILEREEYGRLVAEKQRAVADAAEAKRSAKLQIDREWRNAQAEMEQAKQEAKETVDSMQETLDGAYREIEYLQRLNENLLRISKERANAERKLKPKKGHTGYVVLASKEKEYRYKVDRRNWDAVMLWETTVQSPYTVDFTEEQARKQTEELTDMGGLISRIGIEECFPGKYDDMIDSPRGFQLAAFNVMLKGGCRRTIRRGIGRSSFPIQSPLVWCRRICGRIDRRGTWFYNKKQGKIY